MAVSPMCLSGTQRLSCVVTHWRSWPDHLFTLSQSADLVIPSPLPARSGISW
jgi:hypothetical protein